MPTFMKGEGKESKNERIYGRHIRIDRKMPVNKIKNLRDVIDYDPQINEGLFEIIRTGEQGPDPIA